MSKGAAVAVAHGDSPSRIPADSPSKFQIAHSQSEIYDIGTKILLLQ